MCSPNSSNAVIARFLPIVIAPQPPTEWMRTAVDPFGSRFDVAGRRQRQVLRRADSCRASCSCQIWSFGHARAFAHEVDAEVELAPPRAAGQHVLDRGDDVAGLQVAAAEAEAAGVEVGHLVGAQRGDAGVRLRRRRRRGRSPPPCDIAARISRSSGGSTASGWSVRSSTTTPFLPASSAVTRSAGNGRNIVRLSTPDLEPARVAQVVGHRLGVRHHRALARRSPTRRRRAGSRSRARSGGR